MRYVKQKQHCHCTTQMRKIALRPVSWWCPVCGKVCQEIAQRTIWFEPSPRMEVASTDE